MSSRSVPVVLAFALATTLTTLLATAVMPISAHHARPSGVFNDTFSDVQGIVKEVRMKPPHAWIMLEVKGADGELQLWPLEGASPKELEQIGVTADYIKAGDTIKARCRRLRVVEKGKDHDCILGFLKARDGTAKDWTGNHAPIPADF